MLATEIAKPSVAAAQYNIAANHIDNVQIIRMAAEEFTQAMNGVREFNRLQGIDLKSYQCETIFVDPPRSGLDSETETSLLWQLALAATHARANPEHQRHRQYRRQEVRANIRILRAHHRAIKQYTQNKTGCGQSR